MKDYYRPILFSLSVLSLPGCSGSSEPLDPVSPGPASAQYSCVPFIPMKAGEIAAWTVHSHKLGEYVVTLHQIEEDALRLTKTGSVEGENLMVLNNHGECPRYDSETPLDEIDRLLVYGTSPIQELTEEYMGASSTSDPHTAQVFDPETDSYAQCYVTMLSNPHDGGYVEICSGESELEGKHFQWRSVMEIGSYVLGARVITLQLRQDDTQLLKVSLSGRNRHGDTNQNNCEHQ